MVHRLDLLVPTPPLEVLVAQAEVAQEVRQTAEVPLQEQQEQLTPDRVAVAAVIAMIQTHLPPVVLEVRASLSCVTSCPHLQLPT